MNSRFDVIGEVEPHSLLGDFTTELWLPRLAEGESGGWKMQVNPMGPSRGYWGRLYTMVAAPMLMGPHEEDAAAWMSIVPMEIESQEIGIGAAHGHTVVLGLGMGWCAANVALNPAVERVTIVERDPEIVALIESQDVFGQLPTAARDKIGLVLDDALRWRPDAGVDSLQADIWAKFVEPGKWDDIRRIQDNVGAGSIYFWGQEMELWRLACRERGHVPERLQPGELQTLAAGTGLPLFLDENTDYPARIAEAAHWWTPREEGWWDRC